MGKLYKDLKMGLKEIIAYKKGKIALKSEVIQIIKPLQEEYSSKNIKYINTIP